MKIFWDEKKRVLQISLRDFQLFHGQEIFRLKNHKTMKLFGKFLKGNFILRIPCRGFNHIVILSVRKTLWIVVTLQIIYVLNGLTYYKR